MEVKTKKQKMYVAPQVKVYLISAVGIMACSNDVEAASNPWENNTEQEW